MLKGLAIFAFLASAWTMASQTPPANAPENGVTAQGASKARSEQANPEQSRTDSPASAPVNIKASRPSDEQESNTEKQNLDIQRKLEWFTGGLVIVGLMQAGTMIWQAWLLKGTLAEIHKQATGMETQTGRMSRQADLMKRQTVLARESLTATKIAADAAKLSAESTLGQFQAMKAKERARVWIGIDGDLNMGMGPFSIPIAYVVTQTGPTDGFVYASFVNLEVSDVEPDVTLDFSGHVIGIPNRIAPQFEKKVESIFLHRFTREEIDKINATTANVYFMAAVRYKDIFGDPHETSIMKRWRITDRANPFGYGKFAYWEPCGPPEANHET
jgi:hypothetical protein